mmetsp:Transcript_119411/g.333141  ORF Transcript_119411/g.333141 Transcript_119411/m.333141 type:complete len:277 (-) Transcript_119411:1573-2403(-)
MHVTRCPHLSAGKVRNNSDRTCTGKEVCQSETWRRPIKLGLHATRHGSNRCQRQHGRGLLQTCSLEAVDRPHDQIRLVSPDLSAEAQEYVFKFRNLACKGLDLPALLLHKLAEAIWLLCCIGTLKTLQPPCLHGRCLIDLLVVLWPPVQRPPEAKDRHLLLPDWVQRTGDRGGPVLLRFGTVGLRRPWPTVHDGVNVTHASLLPIAPLKSLGALHSDLQVALDDWPISFIFFMPFHRRASGLPCETCQQRAGDLVRCSLIPIGLQWHEPLLRFHIR